MRSPAYARFAQVGPHRVVLARGDNTPAYAAGRLCDPNEVPAPPDEATTRPGDLWLLGNHRLLCGDSSKPEDVDLLLDGAPIHVANTDPPYNVKVEPRSNNAIAAGLSSFETTHHQKMDVVRHPEKAKPTGKKLRAKDRPLAKTSTSRSATQQAEFEQISEGFLRGREAVRKLPASRMSGRAGGQSGGCVICVTRGQLYRSLRFAASPVAWAVTEAFPFCIIPTR
jgi:hypothetical protein